MLTAFATSTLFLVSYLYYHLVLRAGVTRFAGQGFSRPLYFTILISHTILAVVVVPFVLITLARALKGKFARHKAIAPYTFAIWMYVSVTGVVIYLMLYKNLSCRLILPIIERAKRQNRSRMLSPAQAPVPGFLHRAWQRHGLPGAYPRRGRKLQCSAAGGAGRCVCSGRPDHAALRSPIPAETSDWTAVSF